MSALPYCLGHYDSKTWKNCYGIATFSGGDIYIGEFKDLGLAYGRYLWKSGATYVGENRNGKRHGKGVFTLRDGRKAVGEFKNGKLDGYGRRHNVDGSIHSEGIFKNGKFIKTDSNSSKIIDNYSAVLSNHLYEGFEEDPIINSARRATSGDMDAFQYTLRRCSGLLLAAGTALHKLMKDEKAQESVDLGEDLIGELAKAQIQFEGKELTQDIFNSFYKKNLPSVSRFNKLYRDRFQRNFTVSNTLIEKDPLMHEETTVCVGIHYQLLGEES